MADANVVPVGAIQQRILLIRGEKVIVAADLAEFYGVPTRRPNEQVKRNRTRFPLDFMFELTSQEKDEVVANCDHLSKLKYSKALPHAFTEHGAIMAATVLNSRRAVEVSVFVVRAFVALRRAIAENRELAAKVRQLERRLADHDEPILVLIKTIKKPMGPGSVPRKRRIGFYQDQP
jgi:hypothetical protein